MQLVIVRWVDATYEMDLDIGKKLTPSIAETVGFLLEDVPAYVTVVSELFEDGTMRAVTTVPRECIKSVRKLKR